MVSPVITFLQADRGADVAGHDLGDLFALVGVHASRRPTRSLRALGGVHHAGARLELARVDPEEGELADERVAHDLEHQTPRTAASSVGLASQLVLGAGLETLRGRDVHRRRQVVDDRVEQRLHALVLEGAAADHRLQAVGDGRAAQRGAELVVGDLVARRGTSRAAGRRSRKSPRPSPRAPCGRDRRYSSGMSTTS